MELNGGTQHSSPCLLEPCLAKKGGHGIFFTRWLPKTSANSLNTVFHSFQHTQFHSSSVDFGSRRLSLLLLPARASETVRDVKGLLRIHQMEASTTKPDLHTGLAQCLPFTFLLSLHRSSRTHTLHGSSASSNHGKSTRRRFSCHLFGN